MDNMDKFKDMINGKRQTQKNTHCFILLIQAQIWENLTYPMKGRSVTIENGAEI